MRYTMSKEVDETLKRVYEKSNILEILLQNELDNNFIEKRFNELLKLFNVKKGDTIIDLGANIGQQVDYALDVGATIHCFEPHPRIFKFLEKKYSDNNSVILKKGMILSNEPGYYEKNKFGIRIENLIYVDEDKKKLCFKKIETKYKKSV